jgi:hypothetical protein
MNDATVKLTKHDEFDCTYAAVMDLIISFWLMTRHRTIHEVNWIQRAIEPTLPILIMNPDSCHHYTGPSVWVLKGDSQAVNGVEVIAPEEKDSDFVAA